MAFNRESFEHFWKHLEVLFGNKVDKEKGKSLMKDTEIARLASVKTGIELDTEDFELEEGVFITNADQLGGINAEDYVTEDELTAKLEEGVITVNGQKGNVSITAESIGAITNINGVAPNEDGTFELNASNVGGLTVDLDGALEGQGPKINADLLAGKEASEYALVANIVTSVNGQTGDVVITEGGGQMDTTGFYSVSNPPPYPVTSVNGKTGAIEITAASLGAVTSVPVTSVNSKTGVVKLTADDVGALPNTYEPPVTSVNGQTGNVIITAPVTSVNGQTGDVTVTGAVQSVNGKSGVVTLTASDLNLGSAATANTSDFAPVGHASSANTYGAASSSNYGHVKLSASTSSTSGVSNGVAATPSAVKAAYDKAAAAAKVSYTRITQGEVDEYYDITVPANTTYMVANALDPLVTSTSTMPAGNYDGFQIEEVGQGISYPGSYIVPISCKTGFVSTILNNSSSAALVVYNLGKSAGALKNSVNLLFINPTSSSLVFRMYNWY